MRVENLLNDFVKPARTLGVDPSEKERLKVIKDICFEAPFTHTRNKFTSFLYPSLSCVCTCQKRSHCILPFGRKYLTFSSPLDNDECKTGTHSCSQNATCDNTVGESLNLMSAISCFHCCSFLLACASNISIL